MREKWTAVWGNSINCDELRPAAYAKDVTIRTYITVSVAGSAIRLRFANIYGREDVTLTAVSVAKSAEDYCSSGFKKVTFGGAESGTICKGGYLYSDKIDFSVNAGEKIAVSIYLGEYSDVRTSISTQGPLTYNEYANGKYYLSEQLPPERSTNGNRSFLLDTVEMLTAENTFSVIAFGDSITMMSWPEWLQTRLIENGNTAASVVRRAVSGGRVLREYTHDAKLCYGHAGIARFEKDVCETPGADRVFVLHSINDIIHPDGSRFRPMSDLPTAQEIIGGFEKYVETAHKHGIRIYFATLTPFGGYPKYDDRRYLRDAVNEWVRSNTVADGYIDFAAAIADPADTEYMLPEFDSGDHLHPSLEGGKALAYSIPEELLK